MQTRGLANSQTLNAHAYSWKICFAAHPESHCGLRRISVRPWLFDEGYGLFHAVSAHRGAVKRLQPSLALRDMGFLFRAFVEDCRWPAFVCTTGDLEQWFPQRTLW